MSVAGEDNSGSFEGVLKDGTRVTYWENGEKSEIWSREREAAMTRATAGNLCLRPMPTPDDYRWDWWGFIQKELLPVESSECQLTHTPIGLMEEFCRCKNCSAVFKRDALRKHLFNVANKCPSCDVTIPSPSILSYRFQNCSQEEASN